MLRTTRTFALLLATVIAGAASAAFDGPAPVAWRWAESTTASPGGSPQVDSRAAYVAVGGYMYGIDRHSGNQLWRFPSGEPIAGVFRTGCVLANGVLVAISDDRQMYAVDVATGAKKWQVPLGDTVVATPVVAGDYVVVGTTRNDLYAYQLADGKPFWSKPYHLESVLHPYLAVWDKNVILSTADSSLIMVDVVAQKERWHRGLQRLSPGAFTVSNDRVYVNSNSYLIAFRANTGGDVWQVNTGELLAGAPSASPDLVATVSRSGKLVTYRGNGRPVMPKGVDLYSPVAGAPIVIGNSVIAATKSGSVNLLDGQTGDLKWNFTIPPLFKGIKAAPQGGRTGANSGGGPGFPGAGARGGSSTQEGEEIKAVPAVWTPTLDGDSLFVLAGDGSMLLFDKRYGVDLTAPSATMAWPNAGDQICGLAPLEIVFKIEDWGVGVDPNSIKVTINGQEYSTEPMREGYVSVKVNAINPRNKPLADGRATLVVHVTDWLGNVLDQKFSLTIDNSLKPLGSPKKPESTTGGFPGAGGKGGGGGSADGG
ncbi:MAG: PQQ-binding-like beta-propeller repeat protein [Fimbriimonadaceae bacterium]|nr:PQQ-binding-like beta-propeller repeat protein [Fimbriimonadaceae bacterium]